jgi:hypothetical protein
MFSGSKENTPSSYNGGRAFVILGAVFSWEAKIDTSRVKDELNCKQRYALTGAQAPIHDREEGDHETSEDGARAKYPRRNLLKAVGSPGVV